MARYNRALFNIAMSEIAALGKQAFVPPPPAPSTAVDPAAVMGGGAPPMDPAAMAGMDPAAMGGMPAGDPAAMGGMPVDPAAMGAMDPAAMGAAPPQEMAPDGLPADGAGGPPKPNNDDTKAAVREVLQETGVAKPAKMKPEEMFSFIMRGMKRLAEALNVSIDMPDPGQGDEGAKPASGGSTGGTSSESLSSSGGSSSGSEGGSKKADLSATLGSKLRRR